MKISELGGSRAKSASFDSIGDLVSGKIVSIERRDQTDFDGNVINWDNGEPRKVWVFQLQTDVRDGDDDDGLRSVWAKGGNYSVETGSGSSMLEAIKEAAEAAGVDDIDEGGILKVAYTGEGVKKQRGWNAPKLYTAQYKPPKTSVSTADLFGE